MMRYCWLFGSSKSCPSKVRNDHMLCWFIKKVVACFTMICNLTVPTRILIDNVRADLFSRVSLYRKNILSLHGDWKVIWYLQNFKLVYIEITKQVLSFSDLFLIKDRAQISFLKAFRTTSFFANIYQSTF